MVAIPKKENNNIEFKPTLNDAVIVALAAFSNTKGGTVYAGVSDGGKVVGLTLGAETVPKFINEIRQKTSPSIIPDVEVIEVAGGKSVVALSVKEYPIKPVAAFGKYFKRVNASNHPMSADEITNIRIKTMNTSWDAYPSPEHTFDDIAIDKVQNCMERVKKNGITVGETTSEFLSKCNLERDGKPTIAAYLMFTNKEYELLNTIELGRFQDEITIKDTARTQSDIITQVDEVVGYVKKHINLEVIITGNPQNTQRWQYPLEAIREIVLNMIIHRDYRSNSHSVVKVFNDRIEFYNPGKLPDEITVDDLLANSYRSIPRNIRIAETFKNMGLIEKYGSGIGRIIGYFKDAGQKLPVFEHIAAGFMVTVYSERVGEKVGDRVGDSITNSITNRVTINVTENQQHIMYELAKDPYISTENLSEIIGIAKRNIKENINKLKEIGLLKRVGSARGGYWRVLTDNGYRKWKRVLDEDDTVEETVENVTEKVLKNVTGNVTEKVLKNVTENRAGKILGIIYSNPEISTTKIAEKMDVTRMTVHRDLEKLKAKGLVERVGPDKGGYWRVVEGNNND